jgi:glutamate dehydrogenase/leucine dehydrogenase
LPPSGPDQNTYEMPEQSLAAAPRAAASLKDLIAKFENNEPEIVFEWNDTETEAKGWVVINSLRGGAAGGGTRMRKDLDRHEVVSLAKTMEIKFSISGPAIGGAKSGICFDPSDPRKREVLERWFRAVAPLLKTYYGTGGDLNVDEIHDVIPITESMGVRHPQEGTVVGHFHATEDRKNDIIKQLRKGVKKRVDDPLFTPDTSRTITVADMITGYGVAESIRHYYTLYGGDIRQKRAVIQGWGNVGAAAGYYLAQYGARVTGIIDRHGGVFHEEGYGFDAVRKLFLDRVNNQVISPDLVPVEEARERFWTTGAEIFIPAASSRLVDSAHLERLISGGLEVIGCGANVPFADQEIFFGPISERADEAVSVVPDFISNCGMARTFYYLMGENVSFDDAAIFGDVSSCIYQAMKEVHDRNPGRTGISATALTMALEKLVR